MDIFQIIMNHKCFDKLLLYAITLFGASSMYVFSLTKGFKGASEFLKRFFPGRSNVFYYRLDFLFVSFAGSIIGTIIYDPSTSLQALTAGLTWVGAVNVLTHKRNNHDHNTPTYDGAANVLPHKDKQRKTK